MRNLLIVVTFRSDELHRTHPLRPLLAELARIDWVDRTELPPLTRGQAEELAAIVRGRPPERSLADAIYERAQGNPLFTEELLSARTAATSCPTRWPTCCFRPSAGCRKTPRRCCGSPARAAAATGDALLAQVTGLDAGALAAAIRPAVAANVLVTSGDGYSFRHALIQEAVHADLLPGEHSAVHTSFARAIDADPALVPPGRADIEKAHHWYSAHNSVRGADASWRASVQASNAVAHAERLMLLDRVLELWDQVPDAAAQIGADHVRVLEEAALAARDAASAPRARVRRPRADRARRGDRAGPGRPAAPAAVLVPEGPRRAVRRGGPVPSGCPGSRGAVTGGQDRAPARGRALRPASDSRGRRLGGGTRCGWRARSATATRSTGAHQPWR